MYMRKEHNIRETISGKQNAAINAKVETETMLTKSMEKKVDEGYKISTSSNSN